MIKLSVIVTILVLGTAKVQTENCQECQVDNEAFCATETSYYNCLNGNKVGAVVHCGPDEVCTNSALICEDKSEISATIENVCGDGGSGGCNICGANQKYTCVSRTQAGRCIGGKVTSIIDCDADHICVASEASVCVPQCAADFLKFKASCSGSDYTTTTQAPPATPNPAVRTQICIDNAADKDTLFFYVNYDSTCKDAVYCQRNSLTSSNWVTLHRACPSAKPYFDTSIKDCVATKPSNC